MKYRRLPMANRIVLEEMKLKGIFSNPNAIMFYVNIKDRKNRRGMEGQATSHHASFTYNQVTSVPIFVLLERSTFFSPSRIRNN